MYRLINKYDADCPVDFESLDIRILTSRCKGPDFPAAPCCDAFKKFACPYADILNDQNNNCAESMFRIINVNFPPGLFFDKCVDSERGIECPDYYSNPPSPSPALTS